MTQYTFTILDTTGIQNYIFNSNRLRENIGASQLVKEVTSDWVKETLEKLGVPRSRQHEAIEHSNLPAELIYASGGNAQIIFREHETAIQFTRCLSRRVLREARGIQLLAAHKTFDWQHDRLCDVVEGVIKNELDHYKQTRIPSSPLLGLGVTVSCNSTQFPAIGMSKDYRQPDDETDDAPYPISQEILLKRQAAERAQSALTDLFKSKKQDRSEIPDYLVFPRQLDHIGRTEHESSYIAIVHADGNGMGNRFQEYGKSAQNNRDYIDRMRDFSEKVDAAGKASLRKVLEKLTDAIDRETRTLYGQFDKFELKSASKSNSSQYFLPFRPLVYGGDDVTFICDGRVGIELAVAYLKAFEAQSDTMPDGKKLTACAGVCLVKTHYPFARAYELSKDLCDSGKALLTALLRQEKLEGSAIDWHIANTGLFGRLSRIREREYHVSPGQLNVRPLLLQASGKWRTWEAFSPVLQAFHGDDWQEKRNKVMALREVLTKGTDDTKQFLLNYRQGELPRFKSQTGNEDDLANQGWVNDVCGYFDAIEAMDFYLGLGE
jgi:hypothetical protein